MKVKIPQRNKKLARSSQADRSNVDVYGLRFVCGVVGEMTYINEESLVLMIKSFTSGYPPLLDARTGTTVKKGVPFAFELYWLQFRMGKSCIAVTR